MLARIFEFSERNLETVENAPFFEKTATFPRILSKQGDVLSYKMIACDLLGCSGFVGVCAVYKHFATRGFEFFLLPNRVSVPSTCQSPAEWDFHNALLGVKEQVIAQYGKNSNELQTLGLKKTATRSFSNSACLKPAGNTN